MAIDANGNWYFDPNDFEDQEAFREEAQREQVRDVVKQQKKAFKDQQEIGTAWNDALKSEGLDPQTYEKLYNENPSLAKAAMTEGMQKLVKAVKTGGPGRDKTTGQFVASELAPQGRTPESQQRLDAIKQKAKGGVLTEQDELDVIEAMFPGGL
jgi:hypothetical protein